MSVFKTYKESVLANGSTKGVMFARNCLTGEEFFRSRVDFDYELQCPNLDGAFWLECNPADHLESLESFLTSGKRLASGDLITYLNGAVKSVENPKIMNTCADSQNQRYVLQAAADHVETPEEREEFDRLAREHDNEANQAREMDIDTTPQQVESLSGSEKPNISEWQNGDECVWGSGLLAKIVGPMPSHPSRVVVEVKDALGAHVKVARINDLQKPETPAEREQRERLEAGYDLYEDAQQAIGCIGYDDFDLFKKSEVQVKFWLAIVDKTGHRKESK